LKGLRKIISGAQTGVDRAALDSAIYRLVYCWGGCVPRGRLAEDGVIPDRYFDAKKLGCGLEEHSQSRDYKSRTIRNIKDSDATMILRFQGSGRVLGPGTKLIIKTLQKSGKPYRLFDPSKSHTVPKAVRWVCETLVEEDEATRCIEILNVAGPRESSSPGIYDRSRIFMNDVLGYVSAYQRWGVRIWAP
jgi:hypothetical protein